MSNNFAFINKLALVMSAGREEVDKAFTQGVEAFIAIIFDDCQEGAYKLAGIEVDKKDYVYPTSALASRNVSPNLLMAFELEKQGELKSCDSTMVAVFLQPRVGKVRVFSLEYEPNVLEPNGNPSYMVCESDVNGKHTNYGTLDDVTIESFLAKLESIVK